MPPRVVVVGTYVQDLSFRCADFPRPGESRIGGFTTAPGGKGFNQAVASHRAGVAARFIGAVGRDAFAGEAKKFCRNEKLPARLVAKPGHATAAAAVLVNAAGQNQIVVALGAGAGLRPADLGPAPFRHAKVVVCQHETTPALNLRVFRAARRAGAVTVLNPAPMRADFDPAILALTDVFIPNETEFAAVVGRLPATGRKNFTVEKLHALAPGALHALCRTFGVPTVIVTLGGQGCFVSQPDGHVAIAAHRVKAVDTTGAGDAFVGGFAAGLVKFGGDWLAAARFGNAVAALSVTRPGAAPAMPSAREIARFLKTRA
jgi:ribokinase